MILLYTYIDWNVNFSSRLWKTTSNNIELFSGCTFNVEAVEDNLLTRDDISRLLQENLLKTQKIMKNKRTRPKGIKLVAKETGFILNSNPTDNYQCENHYIKN